MAIGAKIGERGVRRICAATLMGGMWRGLRLLKGLLGAVLAGFERLPSPPVSGHPLAHQSPVHRCHPALGRQPSIRGPLLVGTFWDLPLATCCCCSVIHKTLTMHEKVRWAAVAVSRLCGTQQQQQQEMRCPDQNWHQVQSLLLQQHGTPCASC